VRSRLEGAMPEPLEAAAQPERPAKPPGCGWRRAARKGIDAAQGCRASNRGAATAFG